MRYWCSIAAAWSSAAAMPSCSPAADVTRRCGEGRTARSASGAALLGVAREVFLPRLDAGSLGDYPRRGLMHRDRALVAGVAHERAEPLEQGGPAVLEAGQEGDVDEGPHQPADEAADLDALEADDRAKARDRRHAAEVAIDERLRAGVALQAA